MSGLVCVQGCILCGLVFFHVLRSKIHKVNKDSEESVGLMAQGVGLRR